MPDADLDAAWNDCRMRRGTSGPDDLVSIARAYFHEGYSYGQDAAVPPTPEE